MSIYKEKAKRRLSALSIQSGGSSISDGNSFEIAVAESLMYINEGFNPAFDIHTDEFFNWSTNMKPGITQNFLSLDDEVCEIPGDFDIDEI